MTKFFGRGFESALDRVTATFFVAQAVILAGATAAIGLPL
jgi:hypothetical protein